MLKLLELAVATRLEDRLLQQELEEATWLLELELEPVDRVLLMMAVSLDLLDQLEDQESLANRDIPVLPEPQELQASRHRRPVSHRLLLPASRVLRDLLGLLVSREGH